MVGDVSEGKDRQRGYFVGIIKLNMPTFIVTNTTLHSTFGGEAAVSASFSFQKPHFPQLQSVLRAWDSASQAPGPVCSWWMGQENTWIEADCMFPTLREGAYDVGGKSIVGRGEAGYRMHGEAVGPGFPKLDSPSIKLVQEG